MGALNIPSDNRFYCLFVKLWRRVYAFFASSTCSDDRLYSRIGSFATEKLPILEYIQRDLDSPQESVLKPEISRRFALRSFFCLMLCGINFNLQGCKPKIRKRPLGFLRLGNIENFLQTETILAREWLIIRRDQSGLSAMSSLCTRDLQALEQNVQDQNTVYHCSLCQSRYNFDGQVLKGPAIEALPYYSLHVDAEQIQGPKDTLYVRIGVEVAPSWRLRVIEE